VTVHKLQGRRALNFQPAAYSCPCLALYGKACIGMGREREFSTSSVSLALLHTIAHEHFLSSTEKLHKSPRT
jgi:hypothetical protein